MEVPRAAGRSKFHSHESMEKEHKMYNKKKVSQSLLQTLLSEKAEQIASITLGVVGFVLLFATFYILFYT
jgi:hypothetical protein